MIIEVQVTRETEQCVWVVSEYTAKPRRNAKMSVYEKFFRTRQEAVDSITKEYTNKIARLKRQAEEEQGKLDEFIKTDGESVAL